MGRKEISGRKVNLTEKTCHCCGCEVCASICPTNAISFQSDEEGFWYPRVDNNKCIGCNKCFNACAFKSDLDKKTYDANSSENNCKIPKCYAVKNKNDTIRMNSRSGGLFAAIAEHVILNHGVVYGCIMESDGFARHVRTTIIDDIKKMQGSKYVQSQMGGIISAIRTDLECGKKVLFSGTSCQVAAIKGLFGKDYSNLICIDIVCHGVPSPKVFRDYIKWIENTNDGKFYSIDFRNKKDFGWNSHIETVTLIDEKNNTKRINSEVFKTLFYEHNILRPSCFVCPYKSILHPGDITLADYWGIEKIKPTFNDNKGVSLVLVNTDLGESLFNEIVNEIEFIETNIMDSLQPPLLHPFPEPHSRKKFWKDYKENSFDFISKRYGGLGLKYKLRKDYIRLKQVLYRIIKGGNN